MSNIPKNESSNTIEGITGSMRKVEEWQTDMRADPPPYDIAPLNRNSRRSTVASHSHSFDPTLYANFPRINEHKIQNKGQMEKNLRLGYAPGAAPSFRGSEKYSSHRHEHMENGFAENVEFPDDDIIVRQAAPVIQKIYSQEAQSMRSGERSISSRRYKTGGSQSRSRHHARIGSRQSLSPEGQRFPPEDTTDMTYAQHLTNLSLPYVLNEPGAMEVAVKPLSSLGDFTPLTTPEPSLVGVQNDQESRPARPSRRKRRARKQKQAGGTSADSLYSESQPDVDYSHMEQEIYKKAPNIYQQQVERQSVATPNTATTGFANGTAVIDTKQQRSPSEERKRPSESRLVLMLKEKNKDVPPKPRRRLPPTAFFEDGLRQIDMILCYKPLKKKTKRRAMRVAFRQKFEAEMKNMGLDLEYVTKVGEINEKDDSSGMCFIKIHATWTALTRQAEFEELAMPVQVADCEPKPDGWGNWFLGKLCKKNPFHLPEELRLPKLDMFSDTFSRDCEDMFMITSPDTFFTSQQRILLTWSIISSIQIKISVAADSEGQKDEDPMSESGGKKKKTKMVEKSANILHLRNQGIYSNLYPIHDSDLPTDKDSADAEFDWSKVPTAEWPLRVYLYETWARWGRWHTYQPLDQIKEYYGEKMGLYFAWLGFYTHMLVWPSILGVIITTYGIVSVATGTEFSDWFCKEEQHNIIDMDEFGSATNRTPSEVIFCRQCPQKFCPFVVSHELCGTSKTSRVFDNYGATVYSIFMAIWAVLFLEKWKRYENTLCARWDVSEDKFNSETVRPEYNLKVQNTRVNPVTHKVEPYLPKRDIYQRVAGSISTVIFFITVVLSLMIGTMVYKAAGPSLWQTIYSSKAGAKFAVMSPTMMTAITGSIMNGLCIAMMTKIYGKVCWRLTKMEMNRTEEAFETSYTYKMCLFQFVNFYGALFFLSFIRGQITPNPLDQAALSVTPTSRCPVTGCLLDVSIQLLIVMTGKQILNNVLELSVPLIKNSCRRRKKKPGHHPPRWEKDLDLENPPNIALFSDYLEMLIQFGFITMFVPAFPLAPLFALLNNVLEIRLDAFKMLTQDKRFIPVRAKDIGAWFDLLAIISKVAVFTNAVLIALTSGFIENVVYTAAYQDRMVVIGNGSLVKQYNSFMEFAITPFNTSLWCTRSLFDPESNRDLNESCYQLLYLNDFVTKDHVDLARILHNFYPEYYEETTRFLEQEIANRGIFNSIEQLMDSALIELDELSDDEDRAKITLEQRAYINHVFNEQVVNETLQHEIDNSTIQFDPDATDDDALRDYINADTDHLLQAYADGANLTLSSGNTFVPQCYFRSYRDPHNDYKMDGAWYHIFMAKLAFIIFFEHFVLLFQAFLGYLVPDVPDHVTTRLQRNTFLQREWFKMRELGDKYNSGELVSKELPLAIGMDQIGEDADEDDELVEQMENAKTDMKEVLKHRSRTSPFAAIPIEFPGEKSQKARGHKPIKPEGKRGSSFLGRVFRKFGVCSM